MKICLPTAGKNGMDESVYGHFGSAPYFTIVDMKTKEAITAENVNQHHSHGACQPVAGIGKYDVQAVLTGGLGSRAVQMMNQAGIKVYRVEGTTVREAVDAFEKNQLVELTVENACGHHGHEDNCGHDPGSRWP